MRARLGVVAVLLGAVGLAIGGWAYLPYSDFKSAKSSARYGRSQREEAYRHEAERLADTGLPRAAVGLVFSILGLVSRLMALGGSPMVRSWGLQLSIAGAIVNGILSGEYRGWT